MLEQYRCYAPVGASSARLIHIYLAAHSAGKDRLHLANAKALAALRKRSIKSTGDP